MKKRKQTSKPEANNVGKIGQRRWHRGKRGEVGKRGGTDGQKRRREEVRGEGRGEGREEGAAV